MKMIARWLLLLNKRLYKKITFIIILALVPAVVLGIGIIAQQDSGFATVALAQTDNTDLISNELVKKLTSEESLLRFVCYDSPAKAIESVKLGQTDSAWIFCENMSEKMDEFLENPNAENAVVNVVEREQNVLLRISREKLSNVLYEYFAKDLYIDYVRTNLSELDDLTEQELMEYYNSFLGKAQLFEFDYPSSSGGDSGTTHYLVAPVRGLLSVLVILCAMASAMFFIGDEKRGTFSWLSQSKKNGMEFLCQAIAIGNVAAIMLVALALAGLTVSLTRELLVLALYIIAAALFGILLRELFNSVRILGALIPIFIVAMIALCPVFFDIGYFKTLSMLFPPTYYINSINNTNFIKYLAIYIVICGLLILLVRLIKRIKITLSK